MENYKIYCHIFPNGKRYFGQTKRALDDRFGKDGNCYKDSPLLWNAIQKYGWDNVKHVLVKDGLTQEEANIYEQAYIKNYKTYDDKYGYNLALGGRGHSMYDYSAIYNLWNEGLIIQEIKQRMQCSEKTIREALTSYGISGKERIAKSAGKYHAFTVYQYSKQGDFITSYPSLSEAERITGISHSNIIKVLQGKRYSAGGYRWSKELLSTLP